MTLLDLPQGTDARIVSIGGSRSTQQQLRELGLFPGDTLCVVRRAAFGGPLLVELRGMQIAIGRRVAAQVVVE